jgi:2-C-methyl-D-erythritol 4-phosphate cytidylyltransferase / 2-C-methyl-D-erythritol 2,4-cyclodiphosphate synthase
MNSIDKIAAIVVAAGSGSRTGSKLPKQYINVAGKPMIRHSVDALLQILKPENIFIIIGENQHSHAQAALPHINAAQFIVGGATRRLSVLNGLEAAEKRKPERVLIHDAARPFLSSTVIHRLLAKLDSCTGAVPALPIVDSLAHGNELMQQAVKRDGLWRVQTPQAFRFAEIFAVHKNWSSEHEPTDDASMLLDTGAQVAFVEGDEALTKFTYAHDFETRHGQTSKMTFRSGTGFDVHKFGPGEELWLCGIHIPSPHGLIGHSDADVALHAVVDAILGAAALGDIGDHFPPSDPQWRGVSSDLFVAEAMRLVREKGYELGNLDLTIICETPKIGPHRVAMRARLADILHTDVEKLSVKATTTEGLGFTGRGEGIAAQAIATLKGEAVND